MEAMSESDEFIPLSTSSHRFVVHRLFLFGLLLAFLGASVWLANVAQAAPSPFEDVNWRAKIDPWVWQTAQGSQTEFLVFLQEQADLSGAEALPTKNEKGWFVYRQLTAVALRTQAPLLEQLRQRGIAHRSYWIANLIWVRGDLSDVLMLSRRREVARLVANPAVQLALPPSLEGTTPQATDGIEWNIQKVNADDLWALGYQGQGVVIGGQDTGYDWQHPALKNAYRGWDGSQANHDYNWHDAIHGPISSSLMGEGLGSKAMGDAQALSLTLALSLREREPNSPLLVGEELGVRASDCPYDSPEPCDDWGHGTHTMGIMIGTDGSNQIGMAPEAHWIGCRNMENGVGTPATYMECFQWFIAPTRIDGSEPNPSLAPDVINNSWSCTEKEGCTDPNILKAAVEAVRAAGILTVQSAGNGGSQCNTVKDPAAIYAASFTVGATDNSDNIASFSSRGPVTVDGSNRLKPDVVAPGVNVRSSVPGTGYAFNSGTSMAAPHVAGLAALLISAIPELRGQVPLLEFLIRASAVPLTTTQTCGGVPGSSTPNNTYGWGRIDAWQAYQEWPLEHFYFPFISKAP